MNKKLEKAVEEKILKDLMDNWIPDVDYYSCSTSTSVTDSKFSIEDLDKLVKDLDLDMTPKERTLKATNGRYDTIFIPDMRMESKLRMEFGNLNFVYFPSLNNEIVLVNIDECGVIKFRPNIETKGK